MAAEDASPDPQWSVEDCSRWYRAVREQLSHAMVGQDAAVEHVLIALLAGGHAIVDARPGLGRTRLLRFLAQALELRFSRIQFTPDLLPHEVLGDEVLREDPETGRRRYTFREGPLFAHLVLAADVDRTSPKSQSAFFGAIDARHVACGGDRHALPSPFFVVASRASEDLQATNPLSQSHLDRFLLSVTMDHPPGCEEWRMARHATSGSARPVQPVAGQAAVSELQQVAAQVAVGDSALGYAWTLVRSTRPTGDESPEFVDRLIAFGAGPRGLISLVNCAKARAALRGRAEVFAGDIAAMALPVLRHRVVPNFAAESQNLTSERLLAMIMESVPSDRVYEPPCEILRL